MIFSVLRLFRGWRVAGLLVVAALLSPGRAEARCGHPGALFKTNLIATEPSAKTQQPQPVEAPAPKPCNGPNCSGAPDRNVPPSAPPTTSCAKEAAQVFGTLDPPGSGVPFACDFTSTRPIRL